MNPETFATFVTGAAGAALTGIAWLGRWWWKQKSEARSDAVDSANARAQLNMLADAERRAKEAEAEADKERVERLTAQRDLLKAEGLQKDAERDLRAARRDIGMLRRKLEKAGVPDSDYVPMLETQLGDLPK